jgi:ribosome maturation factor RimP
MGQWPIFLLCRPQRAVIRATGKRELIELLEPTLHSLGYELVDLDARIGSNGLLRLYIDKDPQVTLADCEFVSEQIGAFLDVEDPLPGSYVLEVSSPGADRRLRTPEHYERFVGEEVRVELTVPKDGRKRFRGRLIGVSDGTIDLEVDKHTVHFSIDEISVARLVPHD